MKVLVIHHVNGATKSVVLEAPHVSRQMIDGGIDVVLSEFAGGPEIGNAKFTAAGIVALSGTAVEQYRPITKESA